MIGESSRRFVFSRFLERRKALFYQFGITDYDKYLVASFFVSVCVAAVVFLFWQSPAQPLLAFIAVLAVLYSVPIADNIAVLNSIHRELPRVCGLIGAFSDRVSFMEMLRLSADSKTSLGRCISFLIQKVSEGQSFQNAARSAFSDYESGRVSRFRDYLVLCVQTGKTKEIMSSAAQQFENEHIEDLRRHSSLYLLFLFVFMAAGVVYPVFVSIIDMTTGKGGSGAGLAAPFALIAFGIGLEFVSPVPRNLSFQKSEIAALTGIALAFIAGLLISEAVLLAVSLLSILYFITFLVSSKSPLGLSEAAKTFISVSTLDSIMSFEDVVSEMAKPSYGAVSQFFSCLKKDSDGFGTEHALRRALSKPEWSAISAPLSLLYRIGTDFKGALILIAAQLEKRYYVQKESEALLRVPKYSLVMALLVIPFMASVSSKLFPGGYFSGIASASQAPLGSMGYFLLVNAGISILLSFYYEGGKPAVIALGIGLFYPVFLASGMLLA